MYQTGTPDQSKQSSKDVTIYLQSLYFANIFMIPTQQKMLVEPQVLSSSGNSWRFNQGPDSKCFRTGGKPDSP